MLDRFIGTKIGMTQLFDKNGNVVPVTVVDVNNWLITQVKTAQKDGYNALQLGLLRKRYRGQAFSPMWLSAKKNFFLRLKEVDVSDVKDFEPGQIVELGKISLHDGDAVTVTGTSRGLGFQGVVKRWGFAGGPASHGSNFHRIPGAIGHLTRQGEVTKGTHLPGHMGFEKVTVKGLSVVRIDRESGCVFIKGAIPGKKNSMVIIKKQGT